MVAPAATSSGPPSITRPDRPQGPRLDQGQVEKAVQALIRHHVKVLSEKSKGKAKDLLGDSWEYIHVQLTTVKIPERTTPKPIPISLPHPIYSPEDGFSMCIIVKEDCKAAVKKALQELKIDGAADVVGLQELRTDYKQYQDRRTLRDAFDMFLVDDRIMSLLGRVLGQIFFRKKKQPVPIRLGALAKGDVKGAAQRIVDARNRTYMYRSPGVCTSVKAARTDFAIAKAAENVYQCMLNMVEATPGKWRGVQSLCIKTPESVALPVYNAMPSYLRTTPKPDVNSEDEKEAKKAKKAAGKDAKAVEGDKASTEGKKASSTEGKKEEGKKGLKRARPGAEKDEAPKKIKAAASTEGTATKSAAGKAEVYDGKRKRGAEAPKAADTPEGKGKKAEKPPKASPADKSAAPKGKAPIPAAGKKAKAQAKANAGSKKAESVAAGKKEGKAGKKKGKAT